LLLNFKLAESQSKVCKTSKAHTRALRSQFARTKVCNKLGSVLRCSSIAAWLEKKGVESGRKMGLKHQPQVPFPAKENEKERLRAPHKTTLILLHLPSAKPAVLV